MAFLKQKHACDNCGTDLAEAETKISDGDHEFCSGDCKAAYEEEHDHENEDDDAENVCEFC